jgi:hypothetical protein
MKISQCVAVEEMIVCTREELFSYSMSVEIIILGYMRFEVLMVVNVVGVGLMGCNAVWTCRYIPTF